MSYSKQIIENLLMGVLFQLTALAYAADIENNMLNLETGLLGERVSFTDVNNELLILTDQSEKPALIFNLDTKEIKEIKNPFSENSVQDLITLTELKTLSKRLISSILLDEIQIKYADNIVNNDKEFIYLVGHVKNSRTASEEASIITRWNIKTGDHSQILLDDVLNNPSLELILSEEIQYLIIGDSLSSVILVIPTDSFDETNFSLSKKIDYKDSVYIEDSSVYQLKNIQGSNYILISKPNREVSLYQKNPQKYVAELSIDAIDKRQKMPIVISDVFNKSNSINEQLTSVFVFVDSDENEIGVAEILANDFPEIKTLSKFEFDIKKEKTIQEPKLNRQLDSPILIASNPSLSTIIIGSKLSHTIQVYSLYSNTLEREGFLELEEEPNDMAVSEDGNILVVTHKHSTKITKLTSPKRWDYKHRYKTGVSKHRQVQKLLVDKGYRVGLIDGFLGQQTRQAIKQYQIDNKQKPTGILNDDLIEMINSQGVQSSGSETQECKPLPAQEYCKAISKADPNNFYTGVSIGENDALIITIACDKKRNDELIQVDELSKAEERIFRYQCSKLVSCHDLKVENIEAFQVLCLEKQREYLF